MRFPSLKHLTQAGVPALTVLSLLLFLPTACTGEWGFLGGERAEAEDAQRADSLAAARADSAAVFAAGGNTQWTPDSLPGNKNEWNPGTKRAVAAAERGFARRYTKDLMHATSRWEAFRAWPLAGEGRWVVALCERGPEVNTGHCCGTSEGFCVVEQTEQGLKMGAVVPSVELEGSWGDPSDVVVESGRSGDFVVFFADHGGNGGSREALRGFVLRPDGWHLALEWDETTSQEQYEEISVYPAFVRREFQRRNVPMDQYATVNWSTEYTWSLSPQGVVEIRQPRTEWKGFVRLQQGRPGERGVDWVRVEEHPGRVKRVDLSKG